MTENRKKLIFAIDFDGTCVTHEFPKVGRDIGAVPVLKRIVEAGHKIILFTMRGSGKELDDALGWFRKNDIPLFGINKNPTQRSWTISPKPYANYYIDDAALGCPLVFDPNEERPYVAWDEIERILEKDGVI